MNVAAVQQHFRELATFARHAGASGKVIDELGLIATGLDPFQQHPLSVFVEFLQKAEAFDRTGQLPVVSKPTRKAAAPRAAKPAAADVIQKVVTLYQNILTPTLTADVIEQELALVDTLTGPNLQSLAAQLEIGEKVKKLKSVQDKKTAIKQVIRDRRGMFERAEF